MKLLLNGTKIELKDNCDYVITILNDKSNKVDYVVYEKKRYPDDDIDFEDLVDLKDENVDFYYNKKKIN